MAMAMADAVCVFSLSLLLRFGAGKSKHHRDIVFPVC
jgi:hypothetical protein